MCSRKFSKSLLVAFLILFASCSSLFALAFLPSPSGDSEGGSTGLLYILQSMTSPKYDESSTPSENFEKIAGDKEADKNGMVCFTTKEVKLMDRTLADAEKKLKDEVKPFHFTPMPTIAYGFPNIVAPGFAGIFRYDDFVMEMGAEYDMNCNMGTEQFDAFHPERMRYRLGLGIEF